MGAGVLGLSAYAGYRTYDAYAKVSESDLLLANIEAIADSKEGPDCHNTNGYRKWRTDNYFWEKELEFYDCCYELQKGYGPSGTCS